MKHNLRTIPLRGALIFLFALVTAFFLSPCALAGYLGADINADQNLMEGNYQHANPGWTRPLFNQPGVNPAAFWDNMVEQYDSAQLDFVALWLKGDKQPPGKPATFQALVTAIDKRGLAGRLKIVPFDDNPASWTAQWNLDHGYGYNYTLPFDLSDTNNWTYIWDHNFKVFFENVPYTNLLIFKGRPVISFWSLEPLFVTNANGNASKMLKYFSAQCQAAFGFKPYITVPTEWIKRDPSSNDTNIIDGLRPWFVPVVGVRAHSTWTTDTWNGVTLACVVPGYGYQGSRTWIDPDHGITLATGLQNTVKGSDITWVEGFDDFWEATTTWRARHLDTNGNPLTYSEMGNQDYPNQRINLLRQYGNNPFPPDLKEEAEGCDTFGGAVGGGYAANYYRNGPISIYPCHDADGGFYVGNLQAGEWLEWRNVPMQGSLHIHVRLATPNSNGRLHFVIDGTSYPAINLPVTGGGEHWRTVDAGAYHFPTGSYHTVQLVCDSPGFNVNFWQLGNAH